MSGLTKKEYVPCSSLLTPTCQSIGCVKRVSGRKLIFWNLGQFGGVGARGTAGTAVIILNMESGRSYPNKALMCTGKVSGGRRTPIMESVRTLPYPELHWQNALEGIDMTDT